MELLFIFGRAELLAPMHAQRGKDSDFRGETAAFAGELTVVRVLVGWMRGQALGWLPEPTVRRCM